MTARNRLIVSAATSILAFAGLTPSTAKADLFDDLHVRVNIGRPAPQVQRVWVEPVYETRVDRTWVEPVYQTQTNRVWHEAVYQDRCDKVLIPERWETHTRMARDNRGRVVEIRERVLVSPAHYEDKHVQVLVRDGYFEDVCSQVLVCDGHWIESPKQVCVAEGHWADQVCEAPYRQGTQVWVDGHDRHDNDWRDHDRGDWHNADYRHDDRRDDRDHNGRDRDDHNDRGRRY